jgi:hypothetical protein
MKTPDDVTARRLTDHRSTGNAVRRNAPTSGKALSGAS